jgi:bacterioferritin
MKGNDKLIETLNALLSDELTAVNQYMVHAEMCENWKYQRMHDSIQKRAIQEMKHAEKLIARILFLEGSPDVTNLNAITIGKNVEEQIRLDRLAEEEAVASYNKAIRLASEVGDNGTFELLQSILHDEETHLDTLDSQLTQIKQMDIKHFLADQALSVVELNSI